MNILFYGTNASSPCSGGIARITYNLLHFFNSKGICTLSIGMDKSNSANPFADYQFFFPSLKPYCEQNKKYLEKIIFEHKINVIINQAAISMSDVDFLYDLKVKNPSLHIISCIHNPILNQVENYAYLKEFILKKHHLKLLSKVLLLPVLEPIYKLCGIMIRRKQYAGKLIDKSDKIVMLSPGHMKELTDVVGYKYTDKITYIPNCISLDYDKLLFKDNIILWIGNVDTSIKRIDFMLEVWHLFSETNTDWYLYVLGDGPDLDWAKNYVAHNNIKNIYFEGRVNPVEYYKKAKISCITSSYESFSMVIVESFKYGVVPIVNNSFPSASYLVDNENNGLLVKKFSKKSFLLALRELTSSQSKIEKMRLRGLKSALLYSTDVVGEKWLQLLGY